MAIVWYLFSELETAAKQQSKRAEMTVTPISAWDVAENLFLTLLNFCLP